jgi:HEAT repeat protein
MVEDQDAALEMLIDITRTETDPEIKRDAVFWIGQFDSERAANYLLDVINEK